MFSCVCGGVKRRARNVGSVEAVCGTGGGASRTCSAGWLSGCLPLFDNRTSRRGTDNVAGRGELRCCGGVVG